MIVIDWKNSLIENDDLSKIKWGVKSKKRRVNDSLVSHTINQLDTEGDE